MLKTDGRDCAKTLHKSTDRRSRLRHTDEEFTRLIIPTETDCQIAFVSSVEFKL